MQQILYFKRFKNIIIKNSIILKNFSFLSILEAFNLLTPLLTFPYLIRVLGQENYGIFVFSTAVISYFSIIINYGFNISEIKEISVFRDNKTKISEIISSVLTIKFILFLISAVMLFLTVMLIPELKKHFYLYVFSTFILLNESINANWYFQGLERMKFITYISGFSRILFVISIFLLVNTSSDYHYVPLLNGFFSLLGSIIGLYIIFLRNGINFSLQPYSILKYHFKESTPFFFSRVSVLVILKTNVLVIGSTLGYTAVSYYDLADKITSAIKLPYQIANQVLFPNVSNSKNIKIVLKVLIGFLVIYFIGYFLLMLLNEQIINMLGGPEMIPSKHILNVLSFSSITELISVFLGAPILLVLGYKREYNYSIIWGSIAYLLIMLTLVITGCINLYSIALTTIISSLFIGLYRFYYCKKYQLF